MLNLNDEHVEYNSCQTSDVQICLSINLQSCCKPLVLLTYLKTCQTQIYFVMDNYTLIYPDMDIYMYNTHINIWLKLILNIYLCLFLGHFVDDLAPVIKM